MNDRPSIHAFPGLLAFLPAAAVHLFLTFADSIFSPFARYALPLALVIGAALFLARRALVRSALLGLIAVLLGVASFDLAGRESEGERGFRDRQEVRFEQLERVLSDRADALLATAELLATALGVEEAPDGSVSTRSEGAATAAAARPESLFVRLGEFAATRLSERDKREGLGMAVAVPSAGGVDRVAWWGPVPVLPTGDDRTVSVVATPLSLYMVARAGGSPGVEVTLPIGRTDHSPDYVDLAVPFAKQLARAAGAPVQIYAFGDSRGKPLRRGEGFVVARARLKLPPFQEWLQIRAVNWRLGALTLLLLFWAVSLPWRSRDGNEFDAQSITGGEAPARGLRARLAVIPTPSIVVFAVLLIGFWWRADSGHTTGLLQTLGPSLPGYFTIALGTLLLAIVLHERAALRVQFGVGRKRRVVGVLVLLMASALTWCFWLAMHYLSSEWGSLFGRPSDLSGWTRLTREGVLFLFASSYLLFIDTGFLIASRNGVLPREWALRRSFPVRSVLAALFGGATLLAGRFAFQSGLHGVASVPAALATGLLLFFLLRGHGWRLWNGLGFLLAVALVVYVPVRTGQFASLRSDLETRAARFVEPDKGAYETILRETLASFEMDAELVQQLKPSISAITDRDALDLWLRSPLADTAVSFHLQILDRQGGVLARFGVDMPPVSSVRAAFVFRELRGQKAMSIETSQRRIRGETVFVLTGGIPIYREEKLMGAVLISIPYASESLRWTAGVPATSYAVLPGADSGGAWESEEEYQILSFVGGNLVRTSDDRPAVIARPEGDVERRIRERGTLWTREKNTNGAYRVFYQLDRSAARERIVAFALSDWKAARHIRSMIDIVLKNGLFAAMLATLLLPVALFSRGTGHVRYEATFQDKLVLALLATALLPALLLGGTGRKMVRQYVLDAGEKEARAALESVRYAIEQEIVREAEDLAATTFVRRRVLGLEDEGVIDLEVGLKRFAIYRPNGDLLLQNGRVGDLDRRTLAMVSERLVPAAAVEEQGGLSLTALVPITLEGFEDRLEGVLQLTRPLEDSWVATLGEALGRDITFFSPGRLIASTRSELYRAGLLLPEPPAEAFVPLMYGGESSRIVRQDVAGKPYLIGYGALREFQNRPVGMLGVPLLFREREAATDLARAYDAITYLTFLTLLVVIFAAEFIGQRIARPVADLSDGVRRIASGDLDFSIRKRAGGEIGRLVDSFNGMTGELKRSRESLTERSRFIETILQSVAAGVIAVDREGRIVSANPAAELFMKEHGQEFGETLGGAFASLVNPARRRRMSASDGRAFREEELEVPTRDGRITLRVVASALTDHEGTEIGQVIVFEDLTSLIHSKKLVAWGEMARQVAHEIKNPLTPIKLSAQQIRRAYHDKHKRFGEILDESTDLIIEEIEALRRIATEFSAFARMPKRKVKPVAVEALMSEVGRLYEESLTEGELRTVPPDPDVTIAVDREEMRRVLINLLENAVQAAGTDGTIELEARIENGSSVNDAGWEIWETTLDRPGREVAPATQAVDRVVFTVSDNGPGVSETARGKLFEPNFSTKTNGTGLGLAISRSIVEGYGGFIAIGSTRGVGTVVHVSIPRETESPDGRKDGNADV